MVLQTNAQNLVRNYTLNVYRRISVLTSNNVRLTIQLLNTVTIVIWQLEVGLQALIPGKHERSSHRRMRQAQGVTKFVGRYCK
jgi:hypothetical protein